MATPKKNSPRGRKQGRPKIPVNMKQVERLAALGHTKQDIATLLLMSESTLYERLKGEKEFSEAYERGRAQMRNNLRTWQMKAARDGDSALLRFLGKNELNQSDKVDHLHKGDLNFTYVGSPELGDG